MINAIYSMPALLGFYETHYVGGFYSNCEQVHYEVRE